MEQNWFAPAHWGRQMNEKNLIAVAKALADSSAGLNWYGLDQTLSRQPAHQWFNVVEAVEVLAEKGLVVVLPSGTPSMPVYKLTELGREWLNHPTQAARTARDQ